MRVSRVQFIAAAAAILVLSPGPAAEAGSSHERAEAHAEAKSIVDVTLAANAAGPFEGKLSTLIAALQAADPSVLEALSGNGQFTVFAPTNEAFEALGLDAENISKEFSQEALTEILLFHVAEGRRDASEVTGSEKIQTLQGGSLSVSGASLGDVAGRKANIVVTDIMAANGIIHVIDAVVLPTKS
jgi:uncharacterized surface protein with fasciclin (FAS1) repeats